MISPLSLSAKVFSLNLLYDKAVDDTGVPATLNPFFRLYLVCPLYAPTLFVSSALFPHSPAANFGV